tara:strand:+ start:144 stop:371 length:228 start_codon:yes stop_codon:yes gene_type:complete
MSVDYSIVKKECWERKIYVHQIPTERGGWIGPRVRLVIDFDGQKKHGKDLYDQNSKALIEKIEELYRWIYFSYIV